MARGQKQAAGDMEKILEKLGKLDIVEQKLDKLDKLDDKLEDLQRSLLEIKSEIAATKKDLSMVQLMAKENKEKMGSLEGEIQAIRGRGEERGNVLTTLQMEKMACFLRFQNVQELDQQDLRDVMVRLLGEFTERNLEYMSWDIDQVYRVNSLYATTHGVPREVHIKFVRRETRDDILRRQRVGALTYMGKEVTILKQIPRQVRELRRKYYFLANKLHHKGVGFRWLMPEGLMIFREGTRKKINSVMEAKAYMEEHKALLESGDTGTEEGEVVDEQGAGVGVVVEDQGGGQVEARILRSKTKK